MMRGFHHGRVHAALLIPLALLLSLTFAAPRAGDLLAEPARATIASGKREAIRTRATPAPRADGEQTELHAETRNDVKTLAATGVPFDGVDAELALAWRRGDCHLNPGNPSCVMIGLAAGCETDPGDPGCRADHDGDACIDVAEVRSGLDPFQPADCVGGRNRSPALNCLFLSFNLACHGRGHALALATPNSGAERGAARVELALASSSRPRQTWIVPCSPGIRPAMGSRRTRNDRPRYAPIAT